MFLTILKDFNFGLGCRSKVPTKLYESEVVCHVYCTGRSHSGRATSHKGIEVSQVSGFLRVKTLHKFSIGSI